MYNHESQDMWDGSQEGTGEWRASPRQVVGLPSPYLVLNTRGITQGFWEAAGRPGTGVVHRGITFPFQEVAAHTSPPSPPTPHHPTYIPAPPYPPTSNSSTTWHLVNRYIHVFSWHIIFSLFTHSFASSFVCLCICAHFYLLETVCI